MTTADTPPERSGRPPWLRRAIWIAVLAVVLVVAYFIAAAFLPRWWALQAGHLADGNMGQGIMWGQVLGALCTLVPLLLFWFAWRLRKRKRLRWLLFTLVGLGVAAAVPNLLTLAVVLGGNNSAHAGQRIMDVDAPGFRGASLVGAVGGAALFVVVVVLNAVYRRRGREVASLRAERSNTDT